jgi:beta-glucosidase
VYWYALLLSVLTLSIAVNAQSKAKPKTVSGPWMNPSLSPDERASLVLKEMTLDEKISLLHGTGMEAGLGPISPLHMYSNGGAGYVVGVARLGIPDIQISDAAYGVRQSGQNGRYSTALPSNLGAAASWDLKAAFEYGALIGRELRDQGYNMSLGGGVNLTREPRNGRTFEYMGEDPILAGSMVAQLIKGTQAQHVIGDIKHYALNDQESGRNAVNVNIDTRSMRETDLLAFEIGVLKANPAAVMCSYNRVNGDYACENKYLLTDVLKKDWRYQGFVLSDWGGAHSVEKASAAGLDHEEPGELFYGDALKNAVQAGKVPMAELDDHVHRVLRSMFASGIVDDPPQKGVVDVFGGFEVSQTIEEHSIVLLRNEGNQLPLVSSVSSIAVIGAHSDVGMISGGGSAQVDPPGGNAIKPPGQGRTKWQDEIWFPTSPLKTIRARVPQVKVQYDPGTDPTAAAAVAKSADVALVFAYQWESEGMDLPTLGLQHNQNELISAVAAANPHTVVVLESGGPVLMPWVNQVSAVLEVWFPGSRGADAVTRVLFGDVNPSAKLPITFPKSDDDLPHPTIVKPPKESVPDESKPDHWKQVAKGLSAFQVKYDEGLKVGYKWYEAENKAVLFSFGYGLSYTTYAYSGLKVTPGDKVSVSFTLQNTGNRDGEEIAEVYVSLPPNTGEPPKRLVGWNKVALKAGESKEVMVEVERKFLSIFNVDRNAWQLVPGEYAVMVGGSSESLPLQTSVNLQ